MGDETPALARVTEWLHRNAGGDYGIGDAHDLLSAALHDPDGALARTLCRRIHRSLWPVASAPDPDRPGCANCREHVTALRAAILGEQG